MNPASSGPGCRACRSALHPARLDLGRQPLCNRFLRSRDEAEATFPLSLAACGRCGVMQVVEAAPAKINLALHVRARRPDGYHDLETLFAFAEHGDTVRGRLADDISLTISGPLDGW